MKISEAQAKYRAYRQNLIDQNKRLMKERDTAKAQFTLTGDTKFSEQAAILELSIEETNSKFEENQKVLDSLTEQYAAVWNMEVAKQQADTADESGKDFEKIMTVARRIANGDRVPYSDEKKLMEFNSELYQLAKNAQMLKQTREPKKYKSLWEEKEEVASYDPEEKAENAQAQGELPDISIESMETGDTM